MANSLQAYIFDVEDNTGPRAIITPDQQGSVLGSIVNLDGRASFDTAVNPSGILNFTWSFIRFPIGSQVEIEGFTFLDPDSTVASFAPDIAGLYEIQLIVDDGSIDSSPATSTVDVAIIAVPNNQGLIPDAKFVWNYLSDFWGLVEDKEKFEVIWSAVIQIAASELLKIYQYDYNKSIRDIQKVFQRRWVNYSPALVLDPLQLTGYLADDQAGLEAFTLAVSPDTGIVIPNQPDFFNLVSVPIVEGDFTQTPYSLPIAAGRLITIANQSFTLSRASNNLKAVNEGLDGITTISTDLFNGSGFDATNVGQILHIITGADKGIYLIDTVDNDTDIHLTDFSDPPVAISLTSSETVIEYSITPVSNNISNLFADQKDIPTQTIGQAWRFSSSLMTTEFDLEIQGVSIGDVVEVEIKRLDLNLTGRIRCQVVGVDRGALSFVFNLDDLVDGTAADGVSEKVQESLAEALQVTGLSRDVNGILQYTLEAEAIKNIATSIAFKRIYFEASLTTETEINLGAFVVKLRPLRIFRNSKVLIDSDILSVPMLQEYIRQPDMATLDGQLQIVSRSGSLHPIDHTPYVLAENLDYVIDDESSINGFASTTQNLDEIKIPRGDLIDRSIREGDVMELTVGSSVQRFTIRRVLTPELARVFPTPSATVSDVPFRLSRKIDGRFIRFTSTSFTKDNTAPASLWAELTFFSNDSNIEANFGVMVGVRKDDIDRLFVKAPYKSVVEGLMFALTNGPVHENLRLSAQILLGLPFAENVGVIKEINPAYRVRTDGSPLFGRVLIEAQNSNGAATGVTNIYQIPQGRQLVDPSDSTKWIPATPNEAGIAINPDTGVEYVVGDRVAKFAVLSKGVSIEDYLSDPQSTQTFVEQGDLAALLTQYHSFQLKINADVTTPADVSVTSSFIKRAKPTYVRILAGLLKVVEDFVDIEDALIFGRELEFFEAPYLNIPVAPKLDSGSGDESFLTVDGVMYARYLIGSDLVTTQGSNQVTSAAGGFIDPQVTQSHDTPYIRTDDLLIITEGSNKGEYPVSTVDSDLDVTVTNAGTFETLTAQKFHVFRPVGNRIFQGTFGVTQSTTTVTAPSGMFSANVSVGDVFTFHGGSVDASRKYLITAVDTAVPDIEVTPAIVEATDSYTANIRRAGLEEKYFGYTASDQPHSAGWSTGSNAVVFVAGSSDLDILAFLQSGDSLEADSKPGVLYEVLDFDEAALTAYVFPAPDFTAGADPTRMSRQTRTVSPIPLDLLDQNPHDSLTLELRLPSGGQDLVTTATSKDVTTVSLEDFDALGYRPGDFLVILAGADSSIDIGYGAGIFPIQEIIAATTLRLTRVLTTTNASPGIQYGLQKRES